eukprot:4821778-Amphidinium_carterae.2
MRAQIQSNKTKVTRFEYHANRLGSCSPHHVAFLQYISNSPGQFLHNTGGQNHAGTLDHMTRRVHETQRGQIVQ